MAGVKEIYEHIDKYAPYGLQADYDNSGVNVLCRETAENVTKVLVTLDITKDTAAEAKEIGAQLVISHHPVIFRGIKLLHDGDPAAELYKAGISALSAHTNFDCTIMNKLLCDALGLVPKLPLGLMGDATIGFVCRCREELAPAQMAEKIKSALGCTVVRYNGGGRGINSAAVCTGSGGSMFKDVLSKNVDCYITGDVDHHLFVDAYNAGITIFDAGHFHTENIFCGCMAELISDAFPDVEVLAAKSSRDILCYEF